MKSFCVLPFVQYNNELDGAARPCCENVGGFGNSRQLGILGSWNTVPWRELRKAFVAGERHPACQRCWDLEDRGIESVRGQNNAWHGHLVDLRPEAYDRQTGEMKIPPRNIVLKHSNLCTLSCRMCAPGVSTSVARVWSPELVSITGKPQEAMARNYPDPARFREELVRIGPTLSQVSFSGGEPLADPAVYETLLALQPWAHRIQVYLNTSLTRLRYGNIDTLALLGTFRYRMVCLSIDGPPALHAYIRPGLDLQEFLDNLAMLKRSRVAAIHVNVAVQALNVFQLPETLDFVMQVVRPELLHISLAAEAGAEYLDPRVLPPDLKRALAEKYAAYRRVLDPRRYAAVPESVVREALAIFDKVERFVWSQDLGDAEQWARLTRYYRELDRIHGTSLRAVCPEIAAHLA